ncbi:hypothetical protein [Thiothrix nivea]|nr:hypothetical protein [Thiothrix nivea]
MNNSSNNLNKKDSIKNLKDQLINRLPYAPNTKEAKDYLMSLDIGDVIHIHDFWRQRLITPKPRNTNVPSHIRNSERYIKNKDKINNLLSMIKNGEDITKYLSKGAHSETFDVNEFKRTKSFNSFRDRMLIIEECYHLHLHPYPERSNYIILAYINNVAFEVIGIFTHDIFSDEENIEHESYEKAINYYLKKQMPNGGHYFKGLQNLAGSSIYSTLRQVDIYKIMHNVEVTHDGIEEYTKLLYKKLHNREPKYIKPIWQIPDREIEIFDKKNKITFKEEQLRYRYK